MSKVLLASAAAMLALLVAGQTSAQSVTVYKWVDERGVVHYAQSPPPQGKFERLESASAPAGAAPRPQGVPVKTLQQQELALQAQRQERERLAQEDKAKTPSIAETQAALRKKCEEAKARIAYLQRQKRGPARTVNQKGEVEWWNFEQRGKEINALGQFVDEHCPPE